VRNNGKSGRHFTVCGEGQPFVRRFPGFALSSFWQGQCESEDVTTVRSSGLRQGPRDFHFLKQRRLINLERK
jgi:hypothetical protein